ncbi:MAG: hypothetical protein ACK4RK_06320 [Gemmataceae bacterium]
MSESAQVRSIAALHELHVALNLFNEEATEALAAIEQETRRMNDWLHDQHQYWQVQIRKAQNAVAAARMDLARREIPDALGHVPDCIEQIKALRRARLRLEHAEEQVKRVQHWRNHRLPQAIRDYEAAARPFANYLLGDLPRSLALLRRMSAALEAYVQKTPVVAAPAPTATASDTEEKTS